MNNAGRGFTLVEVLVALVILLAALTVAAASYNASLDFVSRAAAVSNISRQVGDIRQQVRSRLEAGEYEGLADFTVGLSYGWRAVVEAEAINNPGGIDEVTGAPEQGMFQLTLYRVELTIMSALGGREQRVNHQYRELIWQRLAIP